MGEDEEVSGGVTIAQTSVRCAHCARAVPKKDLAEGTARNVTITVNEVASQKVLCIHCTRWLDSGNKRFIEGKIDSVIRLERMVDNELETWQTFADDPKVELLRLRLMDLKVRMVDLQEQHRKERGT